MIVSFVIYIQSRLSIRERNGFITVQDLVVRLEELLGIVVATAGSLLQTTVEEYNSTVQSKDKLHLNATRLLKVYI